MARAALKQRGSLLIWFDPETVWLAEPSGRRGRSATFTDAAIQACLTLKALFGLPLRQTTGLVASLLELAGLDWPVPDFSTLCRRQKGLAVTIPYRPSTSALHLLIDSTAIKAVGEGEWFAKKHGPSKPRQWRKVRYLRNLQAMLAAGCLALPSSSLDLVDYSIVSVGVSKTGSMGAACV